MRKHIIPPGGSSYCTGRTLNAYNGLTVLSEGGFDKHGSQSKAQGAVRVADTQLPAWRATLQHQVNRL